MNKTRKDLILQTVRKLMTQQIEEINGNLDCAKVGFTPDNLGLAFEWLDKKPDKWWEASEVFLPSSPFIFLSIAMAEVVGSKVEIAP